jgi:hypothetical protein
VGALGIGKHRSAKRIDAEARKTYATAKRLYKRSRHETEKSGERLGRLKIEVMSTEMADLHAALSLFRRLDLEAGVGNDPLPETPLDPHEFEEIDFKEWKRVAGLTGGTAMVFGKAAGSATATSVATMGLGWTAAAASTGTAIGSLSGAAATNATLAWFGGGALAAEGAGMAGGAAILGGIAVAPVVLAGGLALLHTGSKALDQARTNEQKAKAAASKSRAARAFFDAVRHRTDYCSRVLTELQAALRALTPSVRSAAKREPDARRLTESERDTVVAAVRLGQLISELVALNIVWRGRLTAKSEKRIKRAQRTVEARRNGNGSGVG